MADMNIRERIVARRRERIEVEGHNFGHPVPAERAVPLVPFSRDPLVICEIKRRSPSRGTIKADLDPLAQAGLYAAAGIRSMSILTEEDHFGGSLADLMAIKAAHPRVACLRKDFLVDRDDILTSFLAGADAILLIASMLDGETLRDLHELGTALGMEVLVEVHTEEEVAKVAPFKPPLMGINCRNLDDFSMDRLLPLGIRRFITWPCHLVFESGMWEGTDVAFARDHGFTGWLIGEAAVRHPDRLGSFMNEGGLRPASPGPRFWQTLAAAVHPDRSPEVPLVKICGLAREEDARLAAEAGADLLGFVFAESPRRASGALVRRVREAMATASWKGRRTGAPPLLVAVVVGRRGSEGLFSLPAEVRALVDEGVIDAVQFSGDERPEDLAPLGFAWYKALRPQTPTDLEGAEAWRSPRILLDAAAPGSYGGSGQRTDPALLRVLPLPPWVAGGLNPANVRSLCREAHPELVDVSSGLEATPGAKDPQKLNRFMEEARYE